MPLCLPGFLSQLQQGPELAEKLARGHVEGALTPWSVEAGPTQQASYTFLIFKDLNIHRCPEMEENVLARAAGTEPRRRAA